MSAHQPRINTDGFEAHDTSQSSDEHFSSASEGSPRPPRLNHDRSPQSSIPTTRVERVDSDPRHGEVPGTPAYDKRTQDAVPDEVEVVPEGQRPRSGTQSRDRSPSGLDNPSRPHTPGGSPVPKLVVEKVDSRPSHGEVEGTVAKELRRADATPDEVIHAPEAEGERTEGSLGMDPEDRQAWFRSMWEGSPSGEPLTSPSHKTSPRENDDFEDDFDDFAEGGYDEDFGDFDDAEITASTEEPRRLSAHHAGPGDTVTGVPSFGSDLYENLDAYLDDIFPGSAPVPSDLPKLDLASSSPFLSDRSLSLWQQLVSPPPMQPPNWTRSRIRRLFLVSLGVPVDLDEILPPSKQKRLILPNINLGSARPPTNAMERLKQSNANDSSTSLDSKTGQPKKPKRTGTGKGPPPPPEFDTNAAALVAATTEEAMKGFTDVELKSHVGSLEATNRHASTVLEYWLQRKDDSLKEKEALEGVIENLVGFVKGRRGN